MVEIVGSSETGSDDAARRAVDFAAKTVRNMRWAEVVEVRAHIADQRIEHWQVKLKIGFTLEDS
jgi:flavin-binding protein dodecin